METIEPQRKKKPYKRVLTDKRRIQNREAQRTYRAKRKERIDFLERAVAVSQTIEATQDDQIYASAGPSQQIEPPLVDDVAEALHAPDLVTLPTDRVEDLSFPGGHTPLDLNIITSSASSIAPSAPLGVPFPEPTPNTPGVSWKDILLNSDSEDPVSTSGEWSTYFPTWTRKDTDAVIATGRSSQSSDEAISSQASASLARAKELLQLQDEADIDQLLELAASRQLDLKSVVMAGLHSLKGTTTASPSHTGPKLNALISRTPALTVSPGSPRWSADASSLPFPVLACPFNNVVLRYQNNYEVYSLNAQLLGMSLEKISRHDAVSPFHMQPAGAFSPFAGPILDFKSVPPDLHPTPSQLRYPHHPFMDLIPFPWFRERAIALAAQDPPAFNRSELKRDILGGGLRCWKRVARSQGCPWDRRSWEAEPWFLWKWGWLVDDGRRVEMQSKWWRALQEENGPGL